MVSTTTGCPEIPRGAIKLYEFAVRRVRWTQTFERYWCLLSDTDRKRASGDITAAYETYRNAAHLYRFLRGVTVERAYIEVAYKTSILTPQNYALLLQIIGESPDRVEAVIDRAKFDGHLVLIEQPHEAYWQGKQIEIDWDRHATYWNYLWQLARRSKVGAMLDRTAFGERVSDKYLTRLKSAIANKVEGFPLDLHDLIDSPGDGTQSLNLDSARIRIFQSNCAGNHVEVFE